MKTRCLLFNSHAHTHPYKKIKAYMASDKYEKASHSERTYHVYKSIRTSVISQAGIAGHNQKRTMNTTIHKAS